MNIKFIVNDYILVWNLLFKSSITENIYNLKQKLYNTYKKEYSDIFYDKEEVIKDYKNFIPNNDLIYNFIMKERDFKLIKRESENIRLNAIKVYDINKLRIHKLVNDILRKRLSDYVCYIVNEDFDILEINEVTNKEGAIILGENYQNGNENDLLINLFYGIVKKEILPESKDDFHIREIVLELAVLNEFATILNGESYYEVGNPEYREIKKQIYPYWLMYLGVKKEKFKKYMSRDRIEFDENIAYENELINMNIEEFIEFIIRNERFIIKTPRIIKQINDIAYSDDEII